VENGEGEVIDASSVPEGMFLITGSTVDLRNSQRAQRWYGALCSSFVALSFFCGIGHWIKYPGSLTECSFSRT